MLKIALIGLNHNTAPIALRECFAFSDSEIYEAIKILHSLEHIEEVILISTCNRMEILMTTSNIKQAVNSTKNFLENFKNISSDKFTNFLYIHKNELAIKHIFRVASSLDSMIVGEPQILGQLKNAFKTATIQKTAGVILNRLLHRSFFVAKKIRSETGIGGCAVSISYAAIELARKIFGSLNGKKVLLIGAGEMAELAVEHLIQHKAENIFVANRTFKRGVMLAKTFNGTAIDFKEIGKTLEHVDIIISSTGASNYIITKQFVKSIMRNRKNRPLFFIDIAMPRDIDPMINRINNSYVYDIDDLKGVIDNNLYERKKEAVKGERIVEQSVINFNTWYENLDTVPTIKALREKIENITNTEVNKTLKSLQHLSDSDRKSLYKMSRSIVNKITHDPMLFLKSNECSQDKTKYIDITKKIFNIENA